MPAEELPPLWDTLLFDASSHGARRRFTNTVALDERVGATVAK
jgi:hypothetical protein